MFQYLLLVSLLLDPLTNFTLSHHNTFSLKAKSQVKLVIYNLKKFLQTNLLNYLLFMVASIFMIKDNSTLIPYIIYLHFCFIFLAFNKSVLLIYFPLFMSVITFYFKLPALLVLISFITLFLMKNYQETKLSTFTYSQNHLSLIVFFVIVSILFFQTNHQILNEQTIILSIIFLISSLEGTLSANKLILERSKNRYILWSVKSRRFNLKFLNNHVRSKIIHNAVSVLYLSLILCFYKFNFFNLIMIALVFIYLALYELDKLIQYKYFNQSIIYDDFLSRFIFKYIIFSGISFYLLFLGVRLILPTFKYLNYIKLAFVFWFSTWILFFFKRFNKKIKLISLSLSLLLILSGCSTQKESLIITNNQQTFMGNMIPVASQAIDLDDEAINLKVSHGDHLKKDELILRYEYEDRQDEIKRIDLQIKQTKESLTQKKNQLIKADAYTKQSLNEEIKLLNDDLKILEFDKEIIPVTKDIQAKYNGTVSIENNILEFISEQLIPSLELSEHEFRLFKEFNSFTIFDLDQNELAKIKEYNSNSKLIDKHPSYKIVFEEFENDCYLNQTIIIQPSSPLIHLPQKFVREDDEFLYALTKETEVEITGRYDELNKQYIITKGLEVGDEILAYE